MIFLKEFILSQYETELKFSQYCSDKYLMKYVYGFFIILLSYGCTRKEPIYGCSGFATNSYSQAITWKKKELMKLVIHPNVPKKYHQSIYSAARVWESAIGYKVFNITVGTENLSDYNTRDNINIISFTNQWDNHKSGEQGRTSIFWDKDEIIEADIMINLRDFKYYSLLVPHETIGGENIKSDLYNLESLLIHEMGHTLGLVHQKGTVMNTHLESNKIRTTLTSSDSAAVQCGYKKTSEIHLSSNKGFN